VHYTKERIIVNQIMLKNCLSGRTQQTSAIIIRSVHEDIFRYEPSIRSAYPILPPMVVNVYVAYIVYRSLRVVVIPT